MWQYKLTGVLAVQHAVGLASAYKGGWGSYTTAIILALFFKHQHRRLPEVQLLDSRDRARMAQFADPVPARELRLDAASVGHQAWDLLMWLRDVQPGVYSQQAILLSACHTRKCIKCLHLHMLEPIKLFRGCKTMHRSYQSDSPESISLVLYLTLRRGRNENFALLPWPQQQSYSNSPVDCALRSRVSS